MSTPAAPAPVPTHLAHFEILRRLGVGGMAEVFLAKRRGAENTFKLLVLKRVLPAYGSSPRFRSMFAEEANLATRLNHPNIVQVYEFQDYGEEGQLLSMEFVEGLDLGKLMAAARTKGLVLPPWVGAHIVAEAAKGLHYAHERKNERGEPLEIVHRDVSPQNVLLSYEGAVKIADFGVATANLFRDEVGVLKGKFGYMSPEQARGERVDRRSDVYALGVILYELLVGRPLHPGLSGDDLLAAVRSGAIDPPSKFATVPPELESIVMRALAARREERYQTARDLANAIARAMLQRQVLVDAAALETIINQLVGREITSPGVVQAPSSWASAGSGAAQHTVAAVRSARGGPPSPDAVQATPVIADEPAHDKLAREVRHVAVMSLHVRGLQELHVDAGKGQWIENEIRLMLDQLAFKHSARLTWTGPDQARAVIGLMANPARATVDAANLAIDIHEFLADSSEDRPVQVQASIGIARGVASGRRDKQGHLVDHVLHHPAEYLATLLCDRAPPACTWVAGGVYRLVRNEFLWNEAPTLQAQYAELQDTPRAMRVHELVRPLTREEREARRAGNSSDLIGRDAEKADLHAAFHQATQPTAEGQGQVVARVVMGEMGIGKTALVNAFCRETDGNAAFMQVDCTPAHSEVPFGSIAELIRVLTDTSADQSLDDAVQRILQALGGPQGPNAQLAVRLAELATGKQVAHYDDEDVLFARKLVISGVRRLIAHLAQHRPVVVVIDGLQWADATSLNLLADLLQESAALPVLLLFVTRPDDRVQVVIEHLVRIELRGLHADEQVRLVEGRLGVQKGVSHACADLIPRVAGNPFFLLEMVEALLERGTLEIVEREGRQELVRTDESGARTQALPSTLEQLIADRLAELPPEEREVVQWLAVAGGPLSSDDLVALGKLASDEPVARLCARGMCDRRNDLVDFRHPIARDVTYKDMEEHDRIVMHRRLGEHLADSPLASGLSAVIVARHFARAKMSSRAADFYLEAAHAARSSYQTQLAIRYYRRVLGMLDSADARTLRAHEALESMARLLGQHRDRRHHLTALRQAARNGAGPQWVALALTRTAFFKYDENLYQAAVDVGQRAAEAARLAHLPHLEVESLATVGEALRELGDVPGALAACDRALEVAKHPRVSPRIRADVLRSRGVLLRRVGRVREAVDCYVEAIAVFRRVGARRPEARAMNALAYAMFVLERFEDSIALGLNSIRIDLSIGGRFQLAKTLTNIGQAYARLGDMPRAMAYLKRARDAHERYGDQDARADTLLVSAEVMLEAGDADAARSFCLDASALNSVTGGAYDDVHEKIVYALHDLTMGDARAAVPRALAARQAAEAQALVSFYCYATAVEALARARVGEMHTAILLATTALGSVGALQGSEYGLEVCATCWEALQQAGSPQANEAAQAAASRALRIANAIRDKRLRALFFKRPLVQKLLDAARQQRASATRESHQPC